MAAAVDGTLEVVDVVDGAADLTASGQALERVAVMSSHGHGRSAAACVSTGDELLRRGFGPVVLIGPQCELGSAAALDGTYVVPLDGSLGDDGVMPLVAAWTIEFRGTPWLIDVVDRWPTHPRDVVEFAYVMHRAGRLRRRTGREVQHETLHGNHPARSILEFAADAGAGLIFMGTDADTRMARMRRRSLTAAVVRH